MDDREKIENQYAPLDGVAYVVINDCAVPIREFCAEYSDEGVLTLYLLPEDDDGERLPLSVRQKFGI